MRLSPAVILGVALAIVASLIAWDTVNPSTATSTPELGESGQAVSGSWYCAAGDTNEGRTTSVVFAPVPGEQPAPTDVVVSTFGGGDVTPGSETRVLPEDVRVDELPSGRDRIGVAARWWGRPAVLSRVWRVGGADFPSGWVAGPCEPTPSPTWFIPGMSTDGGGQARLILANPFDSDATSTVTLVTPGGLLQPRRLENLHVPAGDVLRIELNEFAPEQADLGALVRVQAGRLVAEGVQSFNAAIGGVDGVTLVKAAPAAATRWTIPWTEVADRVGSDEEGDEDGIDSWIWITNPSAATADVQINLHTSAGATPPGSVADAAPADPTDDVTTSAESVTPVAQPTPSPAESEPAEGFTEDVGGNLESFFVEPGTIVRLDMADLLPDGVGVAGISLESTNDVPIVASAGTIRRDPATVLSALAIQIGAPEPDTTWVWSVPPPSERSTYLHVVNLGERDTALDVRFHTGEGQLATFEDEIIVRAGALATVDLTSAVGDAEQLTVYVTADQPIVAGYRSLNLEGRPDLVVGLGASSAAWRGGAQIPTAVHQPDLVQQLGTSGQPTSAPVEPAVEFELDVIPAPDQLPSEEPSPSPSASPSG